MQNGNVANTRNLFAARLHRARRRSHWLDRAFVAGHLSQGGRRSSGSGAAISRFATAAACFWRAVAIEGMTLDYGEGWPRVENLAAQAEFRNEGMSAHCRAPADRRSCLSNRPMRVSPISRTASWKFSRRAAAMPRMRSDSCARRRSMRWRNMRFPAVEAKGVDARPRWIYFCRSRISMHRRVLVHGHLDGATLNRPGSPLKADRFERRFRYRRRRRWPTPTFTAAFLGGTFQMQARAPRNRPVTRTQLEFRGTLAAMPCARRSALAGGVAIGGQTDWRRRLAKWRPSPVPRALACASAAISSASR